MTSIHTRTIHTLLVQQRLLGADPLIDASHLPDSHTLKILNRIMKEVFEPTITDSLRSTSLHTLLTGKVFTD